MQTKLRIGLAEQTLLAALGQAAVYSEKHSTPPPNIQSPLEEVSSHSPCLWEQILSFYHYDLFGQFHYFYSETLNYYH